MRRTAEIRALGALPNHKKATGRARRPHADQLRLLRSRHEQLIRRPDRVISRRASCRCGHLVSCFLVSEFIDRVCRRLVAVG